MHQVTVSRDMWKRKAIERADHEHYLARELRRVKQERDGYKKSAKMLAVEVDRLQKQVNISTIENKVDLIFVSLRLFLVARIGFRAVSRVLSVLSGELGLEKSPCTQTIINWVMRLTISRLQNFPQQNGTQIVGDPFSNGYIWVIDISIGLGSGKILTVLALSVRHHQLSTGAPTLQNVICVGVCVADSWTGIDVAAFLQRLIAVTGRPAAFLKDGGKELGKAVEVLGSKGFPSLEIDDISHVVANILKHEYADHPCFDSFLTCCGTAAKKLKQTVLGCIAPPKVSVKARFMNLHRLVRWADKLLAHSPIGRSKEGSLLAKLRTGMNDLPQHKAFIRNFLRDATPLLQCQKILKTEGLTKSVWEQCNEAIKGIPPTSPLRAEFSAWGEKHLAIAETLCSDGFGLPVCSDIIESMYAVGKEHGTGEIMDANRIAMRLPAMCGAVTKDDAQRVAHTSVREQEKLTQQISSLTHQRRSTLPHPGSLEHLKDDSNKHIEMIPRAGNPAKNADIHDISKTYRKDSGPVKPKHHQTITLTEEEYAAVV